VSSRGGEGGRNNLNSAEEGERWEGVCHLSRGKGVFYFVFFIPGKGRKGSKSTRICEGNQFLGRKRRGRCRHREKKGQRKLDNATAGGRGEGNHCISLRKKKKERESSPPFPYIAARRLIFEFGGSFSFATQGKRGVRKRIFLPIAGEERRKKYPFTGRVEGGLKKKKGKEYASDRVANHPLN